MSDYKPLTTEEIEAMRQFATTTKCGGTAIILATIDALQLQIVELTKQFNELACNLKYGKLIEYPNPRAQQESDAQAIFDILANVTRKKDD